MCASHERSNAIPEIPGSSKNKNLPEVSKHAEDDFSFGNLEPLADAKEWLEKHSVLPIIPFDQLNSSHSASCPSTELNPSQQSYEDVGSTSGPTNEANSGKTQHASSPIESHQSHSSQQTELPLIKRRKTRVDELLSALLNRQKSKDRGLKLFPQMPEVTRRSKPFDLSVKLAAAIRSLPGTQRGECDNDFVIPLSVRRTFERFHPVNEILFFGLSKTETESGVSGLHLCRRWNLHTRVAEGQLADKFSTVELQKQRLLELAEAVVVCDREKICSLGLEFQKFCDRNGTSMQRLACAFLEGLQARVKAPSKPISLRRWALHPADQPSLGKLLNKEPVLPAVMDAANDIIALQSASADVIHIVDLTCWMGQWGPLLKSLSDRPGGPPRVRITAVDMPPGIPKGSGPCVPGAILMREVLAQAADFGINCDFQTVESKLEDLNSGALNLVEGEFLAVSIFLRLHQLPDGSVLRSNPRDNFLTRVLSWRPAVFVMAHSDADLNCNFFLQRMRNAVDLFSTMFEMYEQVASEFPKARKFVEIGIWSPELINVVSCEGVHRVARDETYLQWKRRLTRIGFRSLQFHPGSVNVLRQHLKDCHLNYDIEETGGALINTWKGRPLISVHAWAA